MSSAHEHPCSLRLPTPRGQDDNQMLSPENWESGPWDARQSLYRVNWDLETWGLWGCLSAERREERWGPAERGQWGRMPKTGTKDILLGSRGQKRVLVAQLCLTLCDPMDWSLPGSSVHGILEARILKWVAISLSRGSSRPRNRTLGLGFLFAGGFFTNWATRKAQNDYELGG